MPLHLMTHHEPLVITRLDAGEDPTWDWTGGPFASLTRSAGETSIVCLADSVPSEVTQEGPFLGVEVAGPLAFEAVGVMAEILTPLVSIGISVLAMSTFDTDWILVPADEITRASEAWRKAGLIVTATTLGRKEP